MKYLTILSGVVLALGLRAHPASRRTSHAAADSSVFVISGNVRGLGSGWVLLYRPGEEPTDTALVRDGQFDLSGKISEPELCHLVFGKSNRGNLKSIGFFLQPGRISVTGSKDALGALQFSGAPLQEEWQKFQQEESKISDFNVQKDLARQYAIDHPDSYVAIEEVLEYFSYNPNADTLQMIYTSLAPVIRTSLMGRELKALLDATMQTGIGRPAPDFAEADPKGHSVTLSSLRGQYVLVDFWASWCGPCRAENPNVVSNYRKFHSKGFTVLGVSLDDKKDKWLEAIRQDKLPWTQVSDLKGWDNVAAVRYGVAGIPMNFLLDKDGKIVAKGLRGEELKKKLAEILYQ